MKLSKAFGLATFHIACLSLVALGLLLGGVSCAHQERVPQSSCTIKIAPGNYLFVAGHEFHGEVACTWQEGDTLCIEGIPVLPPRPTPFVLSEERSKELYAAIPYVQDLVKSGMSWQEAAHQYSEKVDAMARSVPRAYQNALEATGSKEAARQKALASLDRSLLDPSVEPEANAQELVVKLAGCPSKMHLGFGHDRAGDATHGAAWRLTNARASSEVSSLAQSLGREGVPVVVVLLPGDDRLYGKDAQKALAQIEQAAKGQPAPGLLSEEQIQLILSAEQGRAK
jgi:hypothetical protein